MESPFPIAQNETEARYLIYSQLYHSQIKRNAPSDEVLRTLDYMLHYRDKAVEILLSSKK